MGMVWDRVLYYCTTNSTEGQTNTISKTHGQKPNPIALPFKKFGKTNLVESEVSRDQMSNGNEIRRERDLLRPGSETKCIDKWQKPSLNSNCLPICKPNRHTKHIHKHLP